MSPQPESYAAAERRIDEAVRSNSAELNLSRLGLTALPDSAAQLTNLQTLDLSNNQLTALPASLAQLTNLQTLDLSNTQLTVIPASLPPFTKLQVLDLSNNQLTALPASLAQLTNLRQLALSDNQLTTIPDWLAQLSKLEWLDLEQNRITAIPDSLAQLTNLQSLDLGINQLTALPDSLAQLTNLQFLYVHNNQLTALPDWLAQLSNLQELRLDNNQLTALPDSLAQLTNLRLLVLIENRLTALPDSLSRLTNLQYLFLNNNQLTALPDSLAQLTNLRTLDLDSNPLPEEILAALASGIGHLFRYLEATAVRKVCPRTVKLVLLGEPKSGKTTLLEALKGNPQPCDESRPETLGVNVVSIEKPHPADHKPMYLSVWDFAGQHIEHATHQFFLTENAVYLILWNARLGAESGKHDLWYWLELLKMRVRDPKFLLVATHVERTPADLNLTQIAGAYSGCQGNFAVELRHLQGVDALEKRILELAAESPALRAEWPPEWLAVRDEVRAIRQKQPHMTPADFRGLLQENNVTEEVAQQDLAGQLHNLGEILYYQGRDELSGLVILNPEWVSELIALVVRSEEVRENRGILRQADLAKLWQDAELEPTVRDHLVRLMDWFDLTYSTGHQTDLGIVVEALPYATPEDLKQADLRAGQSRMEMIFRFPSLQRRLPPGIPTWGIARAHRYSKCKPWRDAAIFEDKDSNSQAMILASDGSKEVRLRVVADYPPFFFGLMEGILRDTFKRYPGVEPERRLPCPCRLSCPSTYLYETVLKRWSKGRPYVTCDQSGDDVAVASLLSGACPPETEFGMRAMHSEMRRLFTEALRAQREQMERTCPSVFTLLPSQEFKSLDTWMESRTREEELELTLYCEHDSGWHATRYGVYRFRLDQEWFDLVKGKWNQFVQVSKRVGPLANLFGKATGTAWVTQAAALGVDRLPEASRSAAGPLARELGAKAQPEVIDIETRHVLEQLIDYLDVSRRKPTEPKNGGLQPYLIEDGRLLWLCPDHLKQYKVRP